MEGLKGIVEGLKGDQGGIKGGLWDELHLVRIGLHGARKDVLEGTAYGIIIGNCDTLQQGTVSKNTVADRTQGTRQTDVLQSVAPSEHIGSNNVGIRVIFKTIEGIWNNFN